MPTRIWKTDSLMDNLGKLRDSDDLADFEIVCRDRTWKVHRLVLALQSDVLYKASISDFKEASEGKIDLSEHEPDHIDRMVKYMYTNTYGDEGLSDLDSCHLHIEMCVLGDKFHIKGLRHLAMEMYEELLGHRGPIIDFVRQTDAVGKLIGRAYEVKGVTTRFAISIVGKFVYQGILLDEKGEVAYKPVMREHPEFAWDVTVSYVERARRAESLVRR